MNLARLAIALPFLLVACGDENRATSPGGVACEHFAEGPILEVTAGASAAAAVDVSSQMTRYDITLGTLGNARGGYLKAVVTSAGTRTFFFDTAVNVAITAAGGALVQPQSNVASNLDCATIKSQLAYTLGEGTYTIEVSTAAETDPVLLVWFRTVP